MMKVLAMSQVPEYAYDLIPGLEVCGKNEPGFGRHLQDTAILMPLLEKVDVELLQQAPNLKMVALAAVGYDNVDLAALKSRGIALSYAPHVNAEAAADFVMAQILGVSRLIPQAAEYVKSGKWEYATRRAYAGKDLYGSTLGIIGMGHIGRHVAKRARAFEMRVICYDPYPKDEYSYVSLEELLKESDTVAVLCPLLDSTKGLLGKEQLSAMKEDAVLVVTSRGGIVDEEALYELMANGHLFGAALDVFTLEPATESPLFTLKNFVPTPHIAGISPKAYYKMFQTAAENIRLFRTANKLLYELKL